MNRLRRIKKGKLKGKKVNFHKKKLYHLKLYFCVESSENENPKKRIGTLSVPSARKTFNISLSFQPANINIESESIAKLLFENKID